MFSPGSLFSPQFSFYRSKLESELFFNTKKRKKRKKSKKNCNCSENQVEVGINLAENNVDSDIIGDRIMFSRNSTFDFRQIIADFERIVKDKEDNDKNNI